MAARIRGACFAFDQFIVLQSAEDVAEASCGERQPRGELAGTGTFVAALYQRSSVKPAMPW
ncbi:MAG: hypothetical protein CVT65_09090 [Actinobacteria bacterium HGW-Actinobacteria-5]|jgi:hypothetical protein|nr:MAG: hypothetical protein CVT65_09090 [Actinobacteria bacterium HGW-Actinobacteria-5]